MIECLENMAVACRSSAWKEDSCLEEELKRYVRQGMERTEILYSY